MEHRLDRLNTIEEARQRIPIGRTRMYALIGSGELESVTIGGRRFITESAITEYIARLRDGPADVACAG